MKDFSEVVASAVIIEQKIEQSKGPGQYNLTEDEITELLNLAGQLKLKLTKGDFECAEYLSISLNDYIEAPPVYP